VGKSVVYAAPIEGSVDAIAAAERLSARDDVDFAQPDLVERIGPRESTGRR
jgi:hypothetical protein